MLQRTFSRKVTTELVKLILISSLKMDSNDASGKEKKTKNEFSD